MNEQEKQLLRKKCAIEIEHRPTSMSADYCLEILGVLDALDERDREVESVREQLMQESNQIISLSSTMTGMREENQRLRKALEGIEEIKGLTSVEAYMSQKARQALSGEEK